MRARQRDRESTLTWWVRPGASPPTSHEDAPPLSEREFFIDNLLVRIHFIIVMIRRTGLAPWECEFPLPGSLTSTFLQVPHARERRRQRSGETLGHASRALFNAYGLGARPDGLTGPYTLHPTPGTLHPYNLHPTPYPTPCTLHATRYTLHPTPYNLRPAPYTLNLTPYTPHATRHTLRPTTCALRPEP